MTTMISEPPPSTTRLGVGFDTNRRPAAPSQEAAWKRSIGTKPIPARLAMLPDGDSRAKRVGISAIVQVVLVGFLLVLPLIFPEQMKTALKYSYTELAQPVTEIPVAPPPPPPKIARIKAPDPVTPPPEAVLNPKQPHIFTTPKLTQPTLKVAKVDAKAPEINQVFEAAKIENTNNNQPKRPRDEVKVGTMSSGNATPATVKAPVEQVQTGGFGTTDGLQGKGNPNAHLIVNGQGLTTLPNGAGYGNGTGGDKGIRGTVASTGFGNGTANPPPSGGKKGSVQSGGFGEVSTAAEAPKKKSGNDGPADTAVVVLDKPRPEYTAEGRSLKLEGDVVLDVVFLTSGHVQVNRVISGLGHGLDESAAKAASQIKFKPALREGQPVDYPARVRIEFRLAY